MAYIVDAEMPKFCNKCSFGICKFSLPLSEGTHGYTCNLEIPEPGHKKTTLITDYGVDVEKPDWCPLVPVEDKNKDLEDIYMELKEFAKMIDGREYGYQMFTKEELQIAKNNRIVIVTGASDDLVELEGAITDEGDCWGGGKISVKAIPDGGIVHNCERSDVFSFEAKWCKDIDDNGKNITWSYDVPIEHEDFIIYEDGEPYCRGFVFRV